MIIEDLCYALKCAGIEHFLGDVENEYNKLQTFTDILTYDACSDNLLWNWLPAIVYERFGLDFYLSNFCKISTDECYVMLHPYFYDKKEILRCALQKLNIKVSENTLFFSLPNVSKIYGGFPWFHSYIKLCNEVKCFDKTTIVFHVYSPKGKSVDMIDMIRKWKNEYRDLLAPRIKKTFVGESFPGIINTFHSPTYIEQKRFSLLLSN